MPYSGVEEVLTRLLSSNAYSWAKNTCIHKRLVGLSLFSKVLECSYYIDISVISELESQNKPTKDVVK